MPDVQLQDARFVAKECCYTCYKITPKQNVLSYADKFFCQESCKDKFAVENLVSCQRKPFHSSKLFLKKDGWTKLGRWFCCGDCVDQDEEVKHLTSAQNRFAMAKAVEDDTSDIDMDI